MGDDPKDLVGRMRDRLSRRAWLLDDGDSYRAGVDDAMAELEEALTTGELQLTRREDLDDVVQRRA